MAVLYVASDQPGAGKTAFCVALAAELKAQGKRASVFKPLHAADQSGADPDATTFQTLLGQSAADWPFAPLKSGLTPKLLGNIKSAFESAARGQDLLLVEGAHDISDKVAAELVDLMDARVLVLARHGPDIEASDLAKWRELFGEQLLGYVINGLTRYQGSDADTRLLPAMSEAGLSSLGVIPEDRRLMAVNVGELASHLDGRFIVGEDSTDKLVEHIMVGGLGLDNGVAYFGLKENKGVVIRGDRPDIQMAALQTPTACMVLTQGVEPIEYVRYEAEEEEVPIIVVEPDTLSTMAALNTVLDGARLDHPAKLERFTELLREHVDLPAIYAGLGLAA